MATKNDKKIVHCSYYELKILAEQFTCTHASSNDREISVKECEDVQKTEPNTGSEDLNTRRKLKQNEVRNKNDINDKNVEKPSNPCGLLHINTENEEFTCVGRENEQKGKRNITKGNTFDRVDERQKEESIDEYRSNKSLYDPVTNSTNISEVKMLKSRDNVVNKVSEKLENVEISENENSKQQKKIPIKKVESLTAECHYLEQGIQNLLSRRLTTVKQVKEILKINDQIQDKYQEIMLMDLSYFVNKELYHNLWRNCVYQIIERLRGLQKDIDSCEDDFITQSAVLLQHYLECVGVFINNLISCLEDKCDFKIDNFLNNPVTSDHLNRQVKMAFLCCHHFLIFLGDIERYKQSFSTVKEWSKARSFYIKASKVAPKNGKPYNQLAVIAVYAKRRLDAVYYYIRSLGVSNPIITAREKLHAIFNDVQRKAYELHKNHQEIQTGFAEKKNKIAKEVDHRKKRFSNKGKVKEKKTTSEGRHELWVFFRGGVRREFLFTSKGLIIQDQQENQQENKDMKISLNEISKQFEVFYLCSHAMLYTKIGVDHFTENHVKVVKLFKTLLKHPSTVSANRLIEIMAINMFEISNVMGSNDSAAQFVEGTPLDLALRLAMDMFECLCEACVETGDKNHCAGNESIILVNSLPALKVWFDWMKDNIDLLRTSPVSVNEAFWICLSEFLNKLIHLYAEEDLPDIEEGDHVVSLTEDDHLNGFKLVAHASKPRTKVAEQCHKSVVCKKLRIEAIQTVARFLCEYEDLPLRFDDNTQLYCVTKIVVATCAEMNDVKDVTELDETIIEDDVIVESVQDYDSSSEDTSPVKELKAKKEALTRKIESHQKREENTKAVLVEHVSKPTLVLEIIPQYLVPDTNCFVDHLTELQRIVEARTFTFVIPLIVINELDGLAKGISKTEEGEMSAEELSHSSFVTERTRQAIDFLEYSFSLSNSQMLALTSKGSVLTTIAFRSEELVEGRGINDDIILNCCHHYCDSKMHVVNKLATLDQPFTLRREVVLITEDRNLRLKAHVQNIPVVTVPQFLEMITS